jgi:glycosyltransferase involved in cell wall biosynthesis
MTDALREASSSPGALAGATILQIVPALREEPNARTAIQISYALLQAGARALVAGEAGPLVEELNSFGGEWVSLATRSGGPLALRRNIRALENLIGFQRVDIVHAHSVSGAEAVRKAAATIPVWLVTTLPDIPPVSAADFTRMAALASGSRVIAPSLYAATPVLRRWRLPRERVTIIPRAVDTAMFDPGAIPEGRVSALRRTWDVSPRNRVVLTPGRVAPWNGQIMLPEVARILVDRGHRDAVFIIVGENRTHHRYARAVLQQAKLLGVEGLFRITGHYRDLPIALALADVVAVTAVEPPVLGRAAAEAQAMGRPVVTSDVGVLPEQIVVPPQLPEDLRTGWIAAANDANDFARALARALSLDAPAHAAISARARQYAEYMFSPAAVGAATRTVYGSLLTRNA